MRFSTVTLLATLSSIALAQNLLDNLPKCAQTCFGDSLGTCNAIDIKCICGNSALIAELSCCVSSECSPDDTQQTIDFAVNLCGANGIQVPTSAGCTGGASSTPSATASGTSSSASSASSSSVSVTASGSPSPSASGSANDQVTTAGSTGAAPVHTGVGMGMALAGLLVAL